MVVVVVATGVGAVEVEPVAGAEEVAFGRAAGAALVVAPALGCGAVELGGTDVGGTVVGGTVVGGTVVGDTVVGDVGGTTAGATGDDGLLLVVIGGAGATRLCCRAVSCEASSMPGSDPPPIAAVSATEPTEQESASGAHSRRHPRSRADGGTERTGTMEVLTAGHESLPRERNRVRSVTGVSFGEHSGGLGH